MKSAWWWGTSQWQDYLKEYSQVHPECLSEFRSSPLAEDHDFSDADGYQIDTCQTQVLDLREHSWGDVRKSYHAIINKAKRDYEIDGEEVEAMPQYQALHAQANGGQPRPDATYQYQARWIEQGYGLLVGAFAGGSIKHGGSYRAFAYWIIYEDAAYYASAPSLEENVMHGIVWVSLDLLRKRGVTYVEMGQIDGPWMTEKERSIAHFKRGWGGEARPYLVARKTVTGGASAPAELVRTV